MPELAYLNGVFQPIEEAKVSIEDRGFQFADGIYEVVVAYNKKPFLLEEHMQRFRRSAAAIELNYDFDGQPLEPIIMEGLRRAGFDDAMIYAQITRGVAPRSHEIPEGMTPTVVLTFKALPAVPDELRRNGASVMTTPETRWANCYVKSVALLPNILAKSEASRRGFDDAVFVTAAGEVRECTSANIFIVTGELIRFPRRTEAVLHGITQGFLPECAAAVGLTIREESFDVEALRGADEVFMSSTAVEVLAITRIDDQPVGTGRVGPHTKRLLEEFQTRSRA